MLRELINHFHSTESFNSINISHLLLVSIQKIPIDLNEKEYRTRHSIAAFRFNDMMPGHGANSVVIALRVCLLLL